MALVTCAGSDVLRGRIRLGIRGPWFAELELDTATMPSGGVSLAATDGITLAGSVIADQGGVFLDTAHVRLVGGAGGLGTRAKPIAYTGAVLRDPLSKLLGDAGETMSTTVSGSILGLSLPLWTVVESSVVTAIDNLCGAATKALGSPVGWRVLPDGTIWLGVEGWPTATLAVDSYVMRQYPAEGRYEIGTSSPELLPGVALTDISKNIIGVDHWIEPSQIRTWAWT